MKQDTTSTAFVIILSLVATIGGFLFGFDSGVINGTVEGFKNAFDSHSIGTGFNVASMLLGCVVGAFFTGMLAHKLERLSRMSSMIPAHRLLLASLSAGRSCYSNFLPFFPKVHRSTSSMGYGKRMFHWMEHGISRFPRQGCRESDGGHAC